MRDSCYIDRKPNGIRECSDPGKCWASESPLDADSRAELELDAALAESHLRRPE